MTTVDELPAHFPLLSMDPGKPWVVSAFGRKGSGKSVFNRAIYRSFPGDKLCLDVNGNAEPGEDAEKITGDPLPKRWPNTAPAFGEERRPRNLYYRARPSSPTYRDDLDRVLGVALFPQDHHVLLWAGEVGELMPNGRPGPHMRELLHQNRHHSVACLFDGPRPVYVDPLVISQSDLIAVYRLPNPNDRKRIADEFGVDPKVFERVCLETWRTDPHAFVLCDAGNDTLWQCPPLPIEQLEAAP